MLTDLQGLRDDIFDKLDVIGDEKKWDNIPDLARAKTRKFSDDFGSRVNTSHSPLEPSTVCMVKSDQDSHRILAQANDIDMESMVDTICNLDSNSIVPNLRRSHEHAYPNALVL